MCSALPTRQQSQLDRRKSALPRPTCRDLSWPLWSVESDRIKALQTSREIALAALDRARSASRPTHDVSPATVDRFARAMREKLSSGEIPFRKAYIRSIVDRIEVDDRCIRIMGRKNVLEQAVLAEGGTAAPMVHIFVPKWRTGQDETANTYVIEITL